MDYRNTEMKIDQLAGYLNDEKINLSPAFQRGRVWLVKARRKLLQNMVAGKPIPSIFLYKEASGTKYSYNILDGKQRLESLILFIGDRHPDMAIRNLHHYFFLEKDRKDAHFWIDTPDGKRTFNTLDDNTIRNFREYSIPTVEINLTDDASLDEIISLFVDINQQGVPVKRFDIVKAMFKGEPLLRSVFRLLAIEQRRRQDVFYRMVRNEFTYVLKHLQNVGTIRDGNARIDRMWEKLLEVLLFLRSKKHRKPVEILKGFISGTAPGTPKLSRAEERGLRDTFRFLRSVYKNTSVGSSRLATDQTHFYTMVTTLIGGDTKKLSANKTLPKKLQRLGKILEGGKKLPKKPRSLGASIRRYIEVSAKQTTDVSRRAEREGLLKKIIADL